MLQFIQVSHPGQIKMLLQSYEPLAHTWIVSDLKSKQEIQNVSLEKYSYYTDDAILRVSDFWRLWIRRIEPTLQVVSSDFIKSLVQNFVDTYGEKLEVIDSEVSTLNKAVQEFAPILLHPASEEVLQEWLSDQAEVKKWQRWYQLAKVCLNFIVYEKNAIDSKWSAAYLQTLDLQRLTWDRKIFIDLGSELTGVEMGLFKHLSQTQDIVIIAPAPLWKEKFPHLLNTYKENFGYGRVAEAAPAETFQIKKEQFVRLSTQLAEVKFSIAKLRQWADSGIALDKMAVISADIEKYWPVLQFYFDEEGLTYRKDSVSQLNSLGDIQNLLAAMKNLSQEVAWDSLEKSFFANETTLQFRFEKFKALFYQLYDEDDLARDQKIKTLFYKKIDFNADIERDEFLTFLVKTWISLPASGRKSEIFELLFKDFLAQSLSVKMRFSRWIQFLKSRLSHKEVTLNRSGDSGVYVLPLMSAQMLNVSHRIYIGLNDEYYHRRQNSLMPLADSSYLRKQFDLAVEASEESYLDFNLRWQSLACNENTIFTSSHLSFKSEPINSSLFFIENSPQSEVLSPAPTRLDERQAEISASTSMIFSNERFVQDKTGYSAKIQSPVFSQLSTSDLENYARCSFKLMAGKGFRLRDLSQVAIDLDPREKGNIAHALFEHCIGLMLKQQFSLTLISEFLDQRRLELNLYHDQDSLWKIQRSKFLVLVQKFHDFELERIKTFEVSVEKKFEMYFDMTTRAFTLQKNDNSFLFNLRVDRIDTHKKNKYCIIYDYKSSDFNIRSTDKWLTEYQFQMLLYLMAVKLTLPESLSVKGSLFYLYKNFNLKKGLIDETIGINEFLFNSRNSSLLSFDEREKLEFDFVGLVADILTRLNEGQFSTQPFNVKICDDCDWRKLCRATHLM